MRSVPVVEVCPGGEMLAPVSGVLVEPGIGPFADGGLDEAFGLAIGSRSVDASTDMFEFEIAAGIAEAVGVEAGSVVGHEAARLDAEALEVGHSLTEEAGRRDGFLVRTPGKTPAVE